MVYSDMLIKDFANLLASDAPVPGGGGAAALTGALGAALTHMVAALTVNKKAYEEYKGLMEQLMEQTDDIRRRFMEIIDEDAKVFQSFGAAMAMQKETDEHKAARSKAMQTALKNCTLVPLEIMRCAFSALELTERAIGKSNTTAVSDLGVAALSLKAAAQSAWLNILINTGSIKDKGFAEKYCAEGKKILTEAITLADKIYSEVEASL